MALCKNYEGTFRLEKVIDSELVEIPTPHQFKHLLTGELITMAKPYELQLTAGKDDNTYHMTARICNWTEGIFTVSKNGDGGKDLMSSTSLQQSQVLPGPHEHRVEEAVFAVLGCQGLVISLENDNNKLIIQGPDGSAIHSTRVV